MNAPSARCRREAPRRPRTVAASVVFVLFNAAAPASAQVNAPASASEPPWLFRAGGSVDLGYTDNVLVTDANRESDFIGTVAATAALRGQGRRGFINATATLGYDSYAHKSNLNSERYSGLISSDIDVFEDTFNVRANAATRLQSTSTSEAQPASERSIGQNQTQVLTYSVAPEWKSRLGDVAVATVSYSFDGTNFLAPPAGQDAAPISDNQIHAARFAAESGPNFTTITWALSGSYEKTKTSNVPVGAPATGDSDRSNAEAILRYRIDPALNLTATAGYDDINESTLVASTQDAYGRIGFNWVPSSRTNITLEGGYRYRGPNFVADISYAPREWLVVRASYNESIETQQRLIARQLGGLALDDAGNLTDPVTGLEPDVTQTPFDLTDAAFRSNAAQLSVSGRVGRTTYQAAGQYETRDTDGSKSEQWSTSVEIGRQLAPRLTAGLNAQYAKTRPLGTGPSGIVSTETTSAGAIVDYQLGPTVFASFRYTYQQRTSTVLDTRENFVLVSLARRF